MTHLKYTLSTIYILLLALCTNFSSTDATTNTTNNLRGMREEDEDCIPRKYFTDAGSGKPLKSFQIVTPGSPAYQYKRSYSIYGDPQGYPLSVYRSMKVFPAEYMKYIFNACTDGQEYEIKLGFADILPGCRWYGEKHRMDITVNGQLFLQDFCVKEAAGGCKNAYVVSGRFYPVGNTIEIEFKRAFQGVGFVSFVSVEPVISQDRRHLKECS